MLAGWRAPRPVRLRLDRPYLRRKLSLADIEDLHVAAAERIGRAVDAHELHASVGDVDALALLARERVSVRVRLVAGGEVVASVQLVQGLWRDRLQIEFDGPA